MPPRRRRSAIASQRADPGAGGDSETILSQAVEPSVPMSGATHRSLATGLDSPGRGDPARVHFGAGGARRPALLAHRAHGPPRMIRATQDAAMHAALRRAERQRRASGGPSRGWERGRGGGRGGGGGGGGEEAVLSDGGLFPTDLSGVSASPRGRRAAPGQGGAGGGGGEGLVPVGASGGRSRRLRRLLLVLSVCVGLAAVVAALVLALIALLRTEESGAQGKAELLFVQDAGHAEIGARNADGSVSVTCVAPSSDTLAFADRPVRWAGRWSLWQFAQLFVPQKTMWLDPPNAVLIGRLASGARVESPVVMERSETTHGIVDVDPFAAEREDAPTPASVVLRLRELNAEGAPLPHSGSVVLEAKLFVDGLFGSVASFASSAASSVTHAASGVISGAITDSTHAVQLVARVVGADSSASEDVKLVASTFSFASSRLYANRSDMRGLFASLATKAPAAIQRDAAGSAWDTFKSLGSWQAWEDLGVDQATEGLVNLAPGPGFVAAVALRAGFRRSTGEASGWTTAFEQALETQSVDLTPIPIRQLVHACIEAAHSVDDTVATGSGFSASAADMLRALGIVPSSSEQLDRAALAIASVSMATSSSAGSGGDPADVAATAVADSLSSSTVSFAVVEAIRHVVKEVLEASADSLAGAVADASEAALESILSEIIRVILS